MTRSDGEACDLLCLDLPRAEALRRGLPGAGELEDLAAAGRALADPTRLAVALALGDGGECCVCDLSWVVGRDEKLVSHHLRLLRAAGLATSRRDGRMVMYALSGAGARAAARVRRGAGGRAMSAPAHAHAGHGHARGGHGGHRHHAPAADADRRWLAIALGLIVAFMLVEVALALIAGSLALLSDAAHMLTDAGAIALALVAARLAARPASGGFTFGLGRAEILAAQANGASLFVLAGVIGFEAVRRLGDPPEVQGALVIVAGVLGAAVNVGAAWALSRAERRSLNVEGARAHVLADLYASLTAVLAGVVIVVFGFGAADAIAALLVAALMLRSGWGLLRDSGRILLEAAPRGVDPQAVGSALARHPGVCEVHDLHVWEVTSGFPALAAHVLVRSGEDCHLLRRALQGVLLDDFAIAHTTLQVDHEPARGLLSIERPRFGLDVPGSPEGMTYETPHQVGDDRGITSPEDPTHEATTPPGNGDRDEDAIRRAEDQLERPGGGH